MTSQNNRINGYAGLMLLVLGAGLTVLIFTKLYLSPQKQDDTQAEFQATNASGTVPATEFGRARANEDAARAVAAQLNAHGQAADLELAP